ncbi:MAG TPA: cation:dicarboxylase symporter family transporter [Stellaceae bacterium]
MQRLIGAIGLPVWMLIGAVAGIAAGIVFGERTEVLQPVGSAYAMMLQVAVYPYLLCSLLYGVGRLTPVMARRLFRASWAVYLFMWAATFIGIRVLACAIPAPPLPSVLTPATAAQQVSLLNLLIPANLFDALGKNYVPAVVVFAIVYGIAIQKIERKAALFEILETIRVASVTIWGWIVRVAPIGVFALFAAAAGTIQPDRMGGLLLYVSLFLIGTVLLAFVVLPAVLAAVAPVGYREILTELRPAFVLALVTTLSVVALPFVLKAAERIAIRAGCPEGDERRDIMQASLSISYVLAQLGNYFLYLLMLFAAYVHQLRLTTTEQLLLPFWTLLSGFGSPTATVDGVVFLTSWLRLPANVLSLFLETWTVTRYGQVALSVMGFGFATTLVPLVYFRKLRPHPLRLCGTVAASAAIFAVVAVAGVALRPVLLPGPSNALLRLSLDPALVHKVKLVSDQIGGPGEPTLLAIQRRGVLRVGYNPNVIPFSYRNARGDLVGFDIAYAYELASDLDVALDLIPYSWTELSDDLTRRRFDIAVGGIYVTDERLQHFTVSRSYFQSPMALIVRSERATEFLDRKAMPPLRLAVFDDPVMLPMVHRLFPSAAVTIVPNYQDLPAIMGRIDAAVWTLEQAGAWAAAHPGFTAVAPAGTGIPMLFAYLLPPGADTLRQYLDQWLELKAGDGFHAAQHAYWIDGKPRAQRRPRWNLLDALFRKTPS